MNGFLSAVSEFVVKIQKRAIEKRKEMDLERQLEEQKRKEMIEQQVKAGGLDPYEVLNSLPIQLKDAFEQQDTELLQKVLLEMDPLEAKYHMKRCVDSGLWVPRDSSIYESEEGGLEEIEEEEEEEGSPGESLEVPRATNVHPEPMKV